MSRSTFAKWDPPLPETRRFIVTNTREPKMRRKGETFTRALEAECAVKLGLRRKAEAARVKALDDKRAAAVA